MTKPLVCCITPTHMPEYWERVKRCYEVQTYKNKIWFPMDTRGMGKTVGALRNALLQSIPREYFQINGGWVKQENVLIAHFDHDDWSAPTRLAEQVAFMQATGAQVVGYHDMPFYDVERDKVLFYSSNNEHYALGTSLMYWREVWERVPFPDQTPEDTTWQNLVGPANVVSCSSLKDALYAVNGEMVLLEGPRMIQTIHKANASPKTGARFQAASVEIERAVRNILAGQGAFVAQ